MNPVNIIRELLGMFEPHADEGDRKRVADEALEILNGHPVIEKCRENYPGLDDFLALLSEAIVESKPGDQKTKMNGLTKRGPMIRSFGGQVQHHFSSNLLTDSIAWLEEYIAFPDAGLSNAEKRKSYYAIERVCKDVLSISLDEGSSLETLFQHYRSMVEPPNTAKGEVYEFAARFLKVKEHLIAAPKEHLLVFQIWGVATPERITGSFGHISLSTAPPFDGAGASEAVQKFLAPGNKVFASVTANSRDGRSAGMLAYRQIGEMLDLMRFAFDQKNAILKSRFLLNDSSKLLLLEIPEIIPNPDTEASEQKLQDFSAELGAWTERNSGHREGRDRVFSAFRLYRVGAETQIFENKLVNWWTGIEYLTKGGKSGGGSIGAGVENSLVHVLLLGYISKHLGAFKTTFKKLRVEIELPAGKLELGTLSLQDLFTTLKDPDSYAALRASCEQHSYLWMHLQRFLEQIASSKKINEFISVHERRLRWQIQRIYRARCDIVHSGRQVVNVSLLCANLEYYLKSVLRSMIDQFRTLPTLTGPAEFFERSNFQYRRMAKQLNQPPAAGNDALLMQTLN
ncbi:MAG: hypothetical protein V4639_10825 [Pseudomonadota bacterium]